MPYRLPPESAVRGIRFQPIYSLADDTIHAWEVLSLLHQDLQHERYFSSQPDDVILNILCWQLLIVANMKNRRRYYFNISARLLSQPRVVERIARLLRPGIVIEIQDPQALVSLSASERDSLYQNKDKIQSAGAEVWIDDLLPEHLPSLQNKLALFDGVKIDKSVLHYTAHEPEVFPAFIAWCMSRVKSVLVEGVENSLHFKTAASAGCHYLQGFMWPEERYSLRYMSVGND
ncbi:EAL domain-containing protein [Enterobacter bugandensis]|uniref:EAL domain-containing protein n=1 Tax=Enterobacter bugandensis TaxID=881260 RepID=A0AA42PNG9_9ENTR|nr:EAL domain-containing protein [Enterobacter bugandensis]MDH1316913.1 EAL domain-containing protein [Enterobacter bugandensis]